MPASKRPVTELIASLAVRLRMEDRDKEKTLLYALFVSDNRKELPVLGVDTGQ